MVVDVEPTYTKEGRQHQRCVVCGYETEATPIAVLIQVDLPQTGDRSRLLFWFAGAILSCIALAMIRRSKAHL